MGADFPKILKNFTLEELASPDTGKAIFHPGFPDALQLLRDICEVQFIVESCCRSEAYNRKIGGVPRSLHIYDLPNRHGQLGTAAIDLRVKNSELRHHIIKHALCLNWSCYIIKGGNLHLDRRDLIGEPVVFF